MASSQKDSFEPLCIRTTSSYRVPVPADPCFDSSPNFKEQPKTILSLDFLFYNHNASDPELDNLVYDWAYPLDDDLMIGSVFNPQPRTAGLPSELAFGSLRSD